MSIHVRTPILARQVCGGEVHPWEKVPKKKNLEGLSLPLVTRLFLFSCVLCACLWLSLYLSLSLSLSFQLAVSLFFSLCFFRCLLPFLCLCVSSRCRDRVTESVGSTAPLRSPRTAADSNTWLSPTAKATRSPGALRTPPHDKSVLLLSLQQLL